MPLVSLADNTPASPAHSRLLAGESDFARVRAAVARNGPERDIFELVRAVAELERDAPPVRREMIGRRLLGTSRTALRRVLGFATMYRLTGDARWSKRAEQEMLALAAFSDWNPSHFLDVAEAATAMAIGYDWLYQELTPEGRDAIRDALITHALRPGDDDSLWWRNRSPANNWLQVCEAGLTLAALAVSEHEPELAARAVARARRNAPDIFPNYGPDGAYVEGPMYWGYGTVYHLLLVEALRTAEGSAGELATNRAFLQSGMAFNTLTAPSGNFLNFGDCTPRREFPPELFWFARETNRPGLVAGEAGRLAATTEAFRRKVATGAPPRFPSRFLPLALLWMPDNEQAAGEIAAPAAWSTGGESPLAVFRAGDGREALCVAIKGGSPRASHGHMDVGSFIMELGGVRWAVDCGMPDYAHVEAHGLNLFGEDRWRVFVVGPDSHSIPLIDDALPVETAAASLSAFDAAARSAAIDLTPLYAGQVDRLRRELLVESSDSVVVRDTLAGAKPGAVYRFSWMTLAKVDVTPTGAVLTQDGRTLRLTVTADAPFRVVDEDASVSRNPWDQPPAGLRRVSILFTAEKPEHALVVRAELGDD